MRDNFGTQDSRGTPQKLGGAALEVGVDIIGKRAEEILRDAAKYSGQRIGRWSGVNPAADALAPSSIARDAIRAPYSGETREQYLDRLRQLGINIDELLK